MLIAFAWGQLFKSEGGKLIVEGDGFSNTLTPVRRLQVRQPLRLRRPARRSASTWTSSTGTYERDGPATRAPRAPTRRTSPTATAPTARTQKTAIQVNEPLEIDGSKVYLIGHGYAPVVTVRDGQGKVVYPERRAAAAHRLERHLAPVRSRSWTATGTRTASRNSSASTPSSCRPSRAPGRATCSPSSPRSTTPVLALSALPRQPGRRLGPPAERVPAGHLQDEAVQGREGRAAQDEAAARRDHEAAERRRVDHVRQGHQAVGRASRSPTSPATAGRSSERSPRSSGLAGSLFIQRRRVWVRATAGADGVTVVEMARPRPQRVREAARGTRRPGRAPATNRRPPARRRSDESDRTPDPDASNPPYLPPKGLRSDESRRRNQREPRATSATR